MALIANGRSSSTLDPRTTLHRTAPRPTRRTSKRPPSAARRIMAARPHRRTTRPMATRPTTLRTSSSSSHIAARPRTTSSSTEVRRRTSSSTEARRRTSSSTEECRRTSSSTAATRHSPRPALGTPAVPIHPRRAGPRVATTVLHRRTPISPALADTVPRPASTDAAWRGILFPCVGGWWAGRCVEPIFLLCLGDESYMK